MEVAMETGTLKELNVKPGDVMVCLTAAGCFTVGDEYICYDEGHIDDDHGDTWPLEYSGLYPQATFRIISRAAQPTSDLTAITTPFGLLDAATQEALRSHGGPYQHFDGKKWSDELEDEPCGSRAYRVKPKPEMAGFTIEYNGHKASAFVEILNGNPDWSTLQVQDD